VGHLVAHQVGYLEVHQVGYLGVLGMTDIEIREFDEMPKSKRSGEYSEILEKVLNKINNSPIKVVGVKFSTRSKAIGFYNWVKERITSDHMSLDLAMRTIDGYVWIFFSVPGEP
jgi:hypothetical protein